MRRLNAEQKKELVKFSNKFDSDWRDCGDALIDLERIYDLNPHEDYDSNSERFLNDLYVEKE